MLILALIGGVLATGTLAMGPQRRLPFLREAGIILGAYVVYFLIRGITEGDVGRALDNARGVVELERAMGLYVEESLQDVALRSHVVITLANWMYTWGHWPLIGAVCIWLYRKSPDSYRTLRNAFLLSGAIGLFFFALLPLAPPRLAQLGFTDTVVRWSGSYHVLQPPSLVNQYAAFPSLHLGWNLLIAITLYQSTRVPLLKIFAVLLPGVMFLSIILTGNHFIVDAAGGVTIALTGLHLSRRYAARTQRGAGAPVEEEAPKVAA